MGQITKSILPFLGGATISPCWLSIKAAPPLAKVRAREILTTNSDPFKHLRDFYHLWIGADYCRGLQDYGNLDDDVYVARRMEQDEQEIRVRLIERLNKLAAS